MEKSKFMESGHFPTLIAAFLYFDVSFMVWVLLGALAPFLSEMLKLTPYQKGSLTAIPLLGGALFRPVLGFLGERFGERRTGLFGLAFTLLPLIIAWRLAHTVEHFYFFGLLLGIGGASFAVALPLAGSWYPPEYQGLVMGIAGAGNSGTLLATLFAPRLAQMFGWANTFALAMAPVVLVLLAFALLAKDSPQRPVRTSWQGYASLFQQPDTAWFCFFYSLTFGGFVGLASFLSTFFHDQYHLSKVRSGDFTTIVVVAGSFLRPVGGWLADKIGGYKLLLILLLIVGACLAGVSSMPSLTTVACLLFLAMGMLGMGNGSVFQLVPQRFPDRIGIMTGLVGAAGGLGGFMLPSVLGAIKDRTGEYGVGILLFAIVFLVGSATLLHLGSSWRETWNAMSADRAGIFCYRALAQGWVGRETTLEDEGRP